MASMSAGFLASTGFLVLLIGFLCGAPLGRAINQTHGEERVRAWRVAHSSLVGGGVMLLAIAPNLSIVAANMVGVVLSTIAVLVLSYESVVYLLRTFSAS